MDHLNPIVRLVKSNDSPVTFGSALWAGWYPPPALRGISARVLAAAGSHLAHCPQSQVPARNLWEFVLCSGALTPGGGTGLKVPSSEAVVAVLILTLPGKKHLRFSPDPAESLLLGALCVGPGVLARFEKGSVSESPSRGRSWLFSAAGEAPLGSPSWWRRVLGVGPRP